MNTVTGQDFKDWACNLGTKNFFPEEKEVKARTLYEHDKGEIIFHPYFGLLAYKAMFLKGDIIFCPTKLSHTFQVATFAKEIAKRLNIDVDLAEAIALGHDIGYPPLGFAGKKALSTIGFSHEEFGKKLVALKSIEIMGTASKRFKAFNRLNEEAQGSKRAPFFRILKYNDGEVSIVTVTEEVLDGIKNHTPLDYCYANLPATIEGQVVRMADNLSYLAAGLENADSYGYRIQKYFNNHNARLSYEKEEIKHQKEVPDLKNEEEKIFEENPLEYKFDALFATRESQRSNAIIERIVKYNLLRINKGISNSELHHSYILMKKIPILRYDPVLEFVINVYWDDFFETFHADKRIKSQVEHYKNKILELFEIIKGHIQDAKEKSRDKRLFAPELDLKEIYPLLLCNGSRDTTIAEYIALLTDHELNKLCDSHLQGEYYHYEKTEHKKIQKWYNENYIEKIYEKLLSRNET